MLLVQDAGRGFAAVEFLEVAGCINGEAVAAGCRQAHAGEVGNAASDAMRQSGANGALRKIDFSLRLVMVWSRCSMRCMVVCCHSSLTPVFAIGAPDWSMSLT